VAREVPGLILLDLVMPEMNGVQFLEQLRKTHPGLPVVIVTGYPDSDLMHQATRYAPLMLVSKPAELEQIERTIRIVLGEPVATRRTGRAGSTGTSRTSARDR
jgi:DNA-binding NarL/FixJ family response regulator